MPIVIQTRFYVDLLFTDFAATIVYDLSCNANDKHLPLYYSLNTDQNDGAVSWTQSETSA